MSERKENLQIEKFSSLVFDDNKIIRKIIDREDVWWFAAIDVASALGYKDTNKAIRNRVPDHCKMTLSNFDPANLAGLEIKRNMKSMLLINESGLYRLAATAKTSIAKKFQDWVFDDLVVTIRKTGQYKLKSYHEREPEQIEWFHNDQITQNKFFQTLAPKPSGYIPQSKEERIKREMKKPLDLSFL